MRPPIDPPDPGSADLARLLRSSLPLPGLPPGFGPAVWARIRSLSTSLNGWDVLGWLFQNRWSPFALAVLFALGIWHGVVSGRAQARQASERRYVLSLVPESSPF